jgi:uncharacterized protein (TIGR02466 family)
MGVFVWSFPMTHPDRWTLATHTLFPTALFVFNLQEKDTLNPALLDLIYRLQAADPGHTTAKSNVLGWHSRGNLFDLAEIQAFKALVDGAIATVATQIGYQNINISAANCWANINPKYASNKIHDHANCLFSGVYYVKTPPDCGSLMFYDPREAKTFYKPHVAQFTAYTADAVAHTAEAGLLLIFPSWLKHGVEPNLGEGDRVSISFNYVFA